MPQNVGHVIQVAGPAVDVQFAEGTLPPIYEAVKVVSDGFNVPDPISVILEVQQHLGEGRVRCVAMAGDVTGRTKKYLPRCASRELRRDCLRSSRSDRCGSPP